VETRFVNFSLLSFSSFFSLPVFRKAVRDCIPRGRLIAGLWSSFPFASKYWVSPLDRSLASHFVVFEALVLLKISADSQAPFYKNLL